MSRSLPCKVDKFCVALPTSRRLQVYHRSANFNNVLTKLEFSMPKLVKMCLTILARFSQHPKGFASIAPALFEHLFSLNLIKLCENQRISLEEQDLSEVANAACCVFEELRQSFKHLNLTDRQVGSITLRRYVSGDIFIEVDYADEHDTSSIVRRLQTRKKLSSKRATDARYPI